MKFPVAVLKSLLFHAWTLHDSYNMQGFGTFYRSVPCMLHAWITACISCMFHVWNMHVYCIEYACSMYGMWCISCMKHACFMLIHLYSMCSTYVFHAWYRRILCMIRHILCVVQVYSMCGTGVFMHGICVFCVWYIPYFRIIKHVHLYPHRKKSCP